MAKPSKAKSKALAKPVAMREPAKRGPKPVTFDLDEVRRLAGDGLTQSEIAYAMGSCPDTWFTRVREQTEEQGFSELADAYKKGKGAHAKDVIGGLAKLAREGNPTALIFLAKAHHGRKETVAIEGTDGPAVAVVAQAMTPEQRKARLEELERKRRERE